MLTSRQYSISAFLGETRFLGGVTPQPPRVYRPTTWRTTGGLGTGWPVVDVQRSGERQCSAVSADGMRWRAHLRASGCRPSPWLPIGSSRVMPTRGSTLSLARRRPPPSATITEADACACPWRRTRHVDGAASTRCTGAVGRCAPPRASIVGRAAEARHHALEGASAALLSSTSAAHRLLLALGRRGGEAAAATACGRPARACSCRQRSARRAGEEVDRPRTSTALPAVVPEHLVHVGHQRLRRQVRTHRRPRRGCAPACRPMCASLLNAPLPSFTSITSASTPGGELLRGCWR